MIGQAPLLAALKGVVGGGHVLTDSADLAGFAADGRGAHGHPLAVVRPASAAEVVAVMRLAIAAGVRLVPQGARTGLVEAGIADQGGGMLLLSLDRLNAIAVDPANRSAQVGAGARLSALNAAAGELGLHYPIDLGADPSVGGMVAANTGGARFLHYGDVRRNLLGLEVATAEPEPRLLRLGAGLWKDNSALDLKQLFVGSCGSMGVVTGASLALSTLPQVRLTALMALETPDMATGLLATLEQHFGALLTAFEGISMPALAAALQHVPRLKAPFPHLSPGYCVLVELSAGTAFEAGWLEDRLGELLTPWLERGDVLDAAMDRGAGLWAIRHAVPEGLRASGRVVACDIALKRGDVMRFRADVAARVSAIAPQLKLMDFGHVGDGGLHFNMVWPAEAGPFQPAVAEAARALVFRTAVNGYGGSFSAEHGIGPANAHWYQELVSADVRALSGVVQQLVSPMPIGRVDFGLSDTRTSA